VLPTIGRFAQVDPVEGGPKRALISAGAGTVGWPGEYSHRLGFVVGITSQALAFLGVPALAIYAQKPKVLFMLAAWVVFHLVNFLVNYIEFIRDGH
jgi:hypothetical protein